jgi:hypothetical protein
MWCAWIQWLKRMLGLPQPVGETEPEGKSEPGAVEAHPFLDTDWGEREHIERLMEAECRHVQR